MEFASLDKARAVGYLGMFWGALSQHCVGGNIADVPDSLLEEWAEWKGKRGVFASFVRQHHSRGGIVNEYDDYSGRLDARREKDRQRQAEWRKSHTPNAPDDTLGNAYVTRDITSTSPLANGVTIRNDTKRYETEVLTTKATTPAAPRRTPKAKSEPKYPHYPTDLCQRLFAKWDLEMAHIDYGTFRKETSIAFLTPEGATRDEAVMLETIDLYAVLRDKATEKERGFYTARRWAADLDVRLMRVAAMPMSVDGLPTEKARLVLEGMAA
jgi:hypothetical protein